MWMKDGVVYTGKLVLPDGTRKWGASDEELLANGWEWVEPAPPEPGPKRYSKLKIIRALGEAWPQKKAELEAAGVLDQFMAAQFMAEDDPGFAPVYASLTDEEKRILDEECRYEE